MNVFWQQLCSNIIPYKEYTITRHIFFNPNLAWLSSMQTNTPKEDWLIESGFVPQYLDKFMTHMSGYQ